MESKIPRFGTAPVTGAKLKAGNDSNTDGRPVRIPRHSTAPVAGSTPLAGLSDIFSRRAEADRSRGALSAAKKEEQRAETLLRVKTSLSELTVDRHVPPKQQAGGLPTRILTTIKEAAVGKSKVGDKSSLETEERRLLKAFRTYSKTRAVNLQTFKKIFKLRGEHFGEQLFRYLDREDTGFVLDEEIVSVLVALEKGSFEEKVAFLWSFITLDGEQITRDELKELIKASASEGNLSLSDDALESLASAFFAQAGVSGAAMTQEQFKSALTGRPELVASLKLGSLRSTPPVLEKAMSSCCWGCDWQVRMLPWYEQLAAAASKQLRVDDIQMVLLLTVVILAEIAGFVVGFTQNDHVALFTPLGWSYPVAKGAARGVQVVLILFPFTVARNLITALRPTALASVLPLDEHLKVHRHLACHFFFWGLVHSIAHFINGARIDDPSRFVVPSPPPPPPPSRLLNPQLAPPLPQQNAVVLQPVYNWYAQETQVTGLLLLGVMVLGYLFVLLKVMHERARRNRASQWYQRLTKLVGNFEAFYFSHIAMAISVLVLLIIHPYPYVREAPRKSTTWLYMLPGVAVYLLELAVRTSKKWLWRTRVRDIKLHPGKVTELQLEVPRWAHKGWRGFNYRPGQYAFINIPAISRWEWHPFSLTSAPGDDFISFHIGAAGNWTTSLYDLSSKALKAPVQTPEATPPPKTLENPFDASGEAAADMDVSKTSVKDVELLVVPPRDFFRVRVDGPFGAPAQDYSKHKVLLLVGAGIGATPFASVLRQLVHDFNASKCWNCNRSNHKLFGVRKAYFYWTIRDQHFPTAFQKTLEEVKAADLTDFLEINIHLTSSTADDFRTTMARVANALQHEQQGRDAFTGVQSPLPTFFGRPVWSKVLTKVALENPGGHQVGVFVCGPAMLTADVNAACTIFNTGAPEAVNPSHTQFLFHKEIF